MTSVHEQGQSTMMRTKILFRFFVVASLVGLVVTGASMDRTKALFAARTVTARFVGDAC